MSPQITGQATPEGTKRFSERFQGQVNPDFYTQIEGITLSTLGLGTYLGNPDQADDQLLAQALREALTSGINVIDTAANYRNQRSERVIGKVLNDLISKGQIRRDEVFVATKGGFIPFDGDFPQDPQAYFRDRFLKTKVLNPEDVVAGCHAMSPSYINDQFEQSRQNLGLETIDLYYIHNPETQLEEVKRDVFFHRIHRAFQTLEAKVKSNQLQFFGTATWNGYRVGESSSELMLLDEIVDAASDHGTSQAFKFIQLPFNLAMPEALTVNNQRGKSILEKARELGIHVMTSASIMQGRILGHLPQELNFLAPEQPDSVKALNYARSALGVDVALCGMKKLEHLRENLGLTKVNKVKLK